MRAAGAAELGASRRYGLETLECPDLRVKHPLLEVLKYITA